MSIEYNKLPCDKINNKSWNFLPKTIKFKDFCSVCQCKYCPTYKELNEHIKNRFLN